MMSPRTLYYGAFATLGSLAVVTKFVILPVIVQMLLYTSCILYISCHHSLSMFNKDPETGEVAEVETVSKKDAMMFPVMGSVALFSMYVAYKFFGKYWVNLLLTTYLTLVGFIALGETLRPPLECFVPEACAKRSTKWEFRIPFVQTAAEEPTKTSFGKVDVLCYIVSAGLSVAYLFEKHWTIHNLFAMSFCIQAVALVSLGKFKVAFMLLTGLFFYDIFWVFGTEVMVAVATQFQGPIKIIFPVSFDPWKQSILGLGDIVIPGIFIAMCLRFDAFNHKAALKSAGSTEEEVLNYASSFPKPFFWSVWVSYLLALILTGVIMFAFNRAQPALLYLVPGTMFTLMGTSLCRGQFSDMLAYDEEDLSPKKEEKDAKKTD